MEIRRQPGLPGGRAVVGGVLMAVAAVGVYLAYDRAAARPTDPVVVADRDLRPGQVLERGDLRTIDADLPDPVTDGVFRSIDAVAGRVALGPIAAGEIVQAAVVTDDPAPTDQHEVAIALPRGQIAVGRLKAGERVDVFVTQEERTTSVVRGATVVQISADEGASLTSTRDVTLVVAIPTGDAVAALVHALRTGDVTVVRSTFTDASVEDPLVFGDDGDAPSGTKTEAGG